MLPSQEFVTLSDKSSMVDELLSLCGWKINKLMSEMEGNQMASLMAHLSPNILQWIKKQVCVYNSNCGLIMWCLLCSQFMHFPYHNFKFLLLANAQMINMFKNSFPYWIPSIFHNPNQQSQLYCSLLWDRHHTLVHMYVPLWI